MRVKRERSCSLHAADGSPQRLDQARIRDGSRSCRRSVTRSSRPSFRRMHASNDQRTISFQRKRGLEDCREAEVFAGADMSGCVKAQLMPGMLTCCSIITYEIHNKKPIEPG